MPRGGSKVKLLVSGNVCYTFRVEVNFLDTNIKYQYNTKLVIKVRN